MTDIQKLLGHNEKSKVQKNLCKEEQDKRYACICSLCKKKYSMIKLESMMLIIYRGQVGTGGKNGKTRMGKRSEGGCSPFSTVLTLGNSNFTCCCCLVAETYRTLRNPMDHSLPGSFLCGISQARILEWVAICSFMGSS